MRRILILVMAVTLAITGLSVQAFASPSSPLVGPWLGQDNGTNSAGTPDNSHLVLLIGRSGNVFIADDGASICELNGYGLVRLTAVGRGTFSPDGMTLDVPPTRAICWSSHGPRLITISFSFVFDTTTGRIATSPGDVCTDWWRPWQPQPFACTPS